MSDSYIHRLSSRKIEESPKSVLLLGPRQTGKSTLIKILKPELTINLADEGEFLLFTQNPDELKQRLASTQYKTVFIDEVQRLPGLLNTVQSILDDQDNMIKFYLTGSSARKLKRGKANLLPGRVFNYQLGPLVTSELNYRIDTEKALSTGTMPGVYSENNPKFRYKTLRSYASTYLKEEIQAEALVRNLEGFSRFLYFAAIYSGHFLDISKLASEAQVPRQSAVRYFEILEDTLIVNRSPSYLKANKKRLVKHPKYYFFDTGVLNGLLSNFNVSPDRAGLHFEHLIFNQILSSAYAKDVDIQISTFRTPDGAEVDFIVEIEGVLFAIEVKHSKNIGPSDLKGLSNFTKSSLIKCNPMIFYTGNIERKIENIFVLPWQKGMREIGL